MSLNKYALICPPARTVVNGLRMRDMGKVDARLAMAQCATYYDALQDLLGYKLRAMSRCAKLPDSVFVEDPAVFMHDVLVITRMQNPARQGEEARHAKFLSRYFAPARTFHIEPPGFVEGGDVLVTDHRLFIGLSARTNAEGAEQLARIAHDQCGYRSDMWEIPKHHLHLKGEITFHRDPPRSKRQMLTVSEEIAHHVAKSGYTIVETPAGELYGGNNISEGNRILSHAGCPKTHQLLAKRGFRVYILDLTEFAKINGAMSCLSKLFVSSR